MNTVALRFLADENFDADIVTALRKKDASADIATAAEAGVLGWDDPLVLEYAAQHDLILLSHDVRTMPGHFGDFLARGHSSPGVLLIPQQFPIGRAVSELLLVLNASNPDDWRDRIVHLPL